MNTRSPKLTVCSADASRQARALWFVFSRHEKGDTAAQVVATLAAVKDGRLSLDGLFTAEQNGRLVGATWTYVQTGGVAVVWPWRLAPNINAAMGQRLEAQVDEYLRSSGVRIAQCVLHSRDGTDAEQILAAGFHYAAELQYFFAFPEAIPIHRPDPAPLVLEAYEDSAYDRLARIVESTYEKTLDCPAMNDIRSIHDVLAGYRATGGSGVELWRFVVHEEKDVGVLLNAYHPQEQQLELIYMGLTPAARGKRWGRLLVDQTLWQARQRNAERLIVAVDAQNTPAVAVYENAGLKAWTSRHVFLKTSFGNTSAI